MRTYMNAVNSKQKHRPVHLFPPFFAGFFIAGTALAQAPSSSTAPEIEPTLTYTVKSSDKLMRLSAEILLNAQAWNEVARYNQLKNPNLIVPGQKLKIPVRFLKSQPVDGKIISAEGDVSLAGKPMQPGAAVGSGSQIKTAANSSAVIELADGSRIKLLPNSVAEIVNSRNYAMRDASASGSTTWFSGLMRLSSGALEALVSKNVSRASPLQIETPTSLVGVRGTEFRVAFEDPASGSARTEVIEGAVRADNPVQKAGADLPMGMGAVIKPAETDVKAVKLLPAPDMSASSAEVMKPQASWAMPVLPGAAAYRVQVASDAQFNKIVRDFKVSSGASAELASLSNGNWYARVRGIDAVGLEGYNTVKLIAIREGQWRVSYSSLTYADRKTMLNWVGEQANGQPMAPGATSLLLARDQALSEPVLNIDSADQRFDLGDLKPGVYFVRLSSKPAQGSKMDSEVYRLELGGNWGQTVFDLTSALQAVK